MYRPKNRILTAGPSISSKEIKYVLDATKNGWNLQYADYIHKFEEKFAKYIGVKHALTTSGGTGSLHLGLAALGVGEGDEVILPDVTYFACSDVIMLLGAKPVFVDVLADTWCIDPEKIEKAITKRTKAIMPVDMYGNPSEMDQIIKIAKKYNIKVLEDACPSVGSVFKGVRPGSLGDLGAFSFQGAKIMTSGGFGGMIVTNDSELFEKIKYLNNHGEEPSKKFWQTSVGYTFEMTNIQAAFALAQLERIEEFVDKKRKIFSWYKRRLGNIEGLSMNKEREDTKSNYTLTTIILDKKFKYSRDQMIKKLREELIDTRPFFYPISMFPMYKEQNTPVAHHVGLNGINLPSGLNLKEEEIDYVSRMIRKLLS